MNARSPHRLLLRALIAALVVIQLAAPLALAQTPAAKPAPALSAAEREAASHLKAETVRDVTAALTSNEMQGRGTGQPGADRAAAYIAERFAKLGLKPLGDQAGGKTSFLQPIKFKSEQVLPDATFKAGDVSLKYKDDFIAAVTPQEPSKEASGGLVFAGYGVVSPDVKRDDLAGVDVKGKIVVVLGGRPNNVEQAAWAKASNQQALFGRMIGAGAAGFVIVYTPSRPTQPFSLAATYLSRRRVSFADAQSGFPIKLPPIVLVSDVAAEKLFAGTGASFADLKAKAQAGEFVSRDLNKPASIALRVKREEAPSSNVVAVLEGADAALKPEAVVYSAHYDAYGIDTDGTIYPGAADNALGIGKLIAIAEAFTKAKAKPRRSIIFLAVTGEEYGLLGAEYWVRHPTWPLEKIAADINFDGIGTEAWGEMHYVVNYGAEHSELGQTVADVVKAMGGEIMPDPFPEENVFFRSDHFAFVRRGVPVVYPISAPAGDLEGFKARAAKWLVTDYHMAADTVQKDWSWKGVQQLAVLGLVVGLRVANQDAMPAWVSTSPYNHPRGTTLPPR